MHPFNLPRPLRWCSVIALWLVGTVGGIFTLARSEQFSTEAYGALGILFICFVSAMIVLRRRDDRSACQHLPKSTDRSEAQSVQGEQMAQRHIYSFYIRDDEQLIEEALVDLVSLIRRVLGSKKEALLRSYADGVEYEFHLRETTRAFSLHIRSSQTEYIQQQGAIFDLRVATTQEIAVLKASPHFARRELVLNPRIRKGALLMSDHRRSKRPLSDFERWHQKCFETASPPEVKLAYVGLRHAAESNSLPLDD